MYTPLQPAGSLPQRKPLQVPPRAFYTLVSWSVLKEPNVSSFLCCQAWILEIGCLLHWFPSNSTQDPWTIKIMNSQNLSERPLSHRTSQTQPPGRSQRNTKRKAMFYSLVFFPRLTKGIASSCHTRVSAVMFFSTQQGFQFELEESLQTLFFPNDTWSLMFIIFLNLGSFPLSFNSSWLLVFSKTLCQHAVTWNN